MKIEIRRIKVAERIRKTVNKIDELAADIRENGLITPIAVMQNSTEGSSLPDYQLLAGLRRLRAMELNGETEIEVNVIPAADAEAALKIEFSENEQREPFTYSEKIDYARLIEEIERVKAQERKVESGAIYGRGHEKKVEDCGSQPIKRQPQTRDIVGEKIGLSGKQYDRAKYIAANAPPEVIDELDRGERSIRGTYDELRAKEKAVATPAASLPQKASISVSTPAALPTKSKPPKPTAEEFQALKVKNDEFVGKYAEVEHKRGMLETELHNTNLQWQCEREGKNDRIAELTAKVTELENALAAANDRIKELEERYEPDKHSAE
ncbi:hypothetical protein FACS1894132_06650 [Clostridia bacterium]|nr:hypothetical protein FACS1894132_06650 [Clostridia bacterium]